MVVMQLLSKFASDYLRLIELESDIKRDNVTHAVGLLSSNDTS
jgi:hypothetical protein